MDLTEIDSDDVDEIESVRRLIERLHDHATDNPNGGLDPDRLRELEARLDGLHQAMSLVVAQHGNGRDSE